MFGTRTLTLLPLAGLAAAASGCVSIQSTSTAQPQSMGPVRLTVTACASSSPGCPDGNAPSLYQALADLGRDDLSFAGQPLVGVRLPDGAVPPDGFNAATATGGLVSFARDASYESELQRFEPAPAGERWWGWRGGQFSYSLRSAQSFTFSLAVSLPRPADGGPLPSPMRWRPVVGVRSIQPGDGLLADRPVSCGLDADDFYTGFSEIGTTQATTVCVGAPTPEATRGSLDAPLTDFGLTATTVTAPAGASTTALFLAKRSGAADAATTVTLSAAGGPPGATVALDRTSASLRDELTPVQATVSVPAGTPAGSYPLTLTATAPGKPTRSATATVVVPAAAGTPTRPAATRERRRRRPREGRPPTAPSRSSARRSPARADGCWSACG